MIDTQIGRWFRLKEFAVSTERPDLIADPPLDAIVRLSRLTVILDRLRDAYGPMRIISGYRSKELNKAIGGAQNSDHMRGLAADCEFQKGVDLEKAWKAAFAFGARQAIYYPVKKFIHVSIPDLGDPRDRGLLVSRDGKYSAVA